jgi:predicted metal-dependent HD superfamily phosphohydrolase
MAAHLTEGLRADLLARWTEPHRRHHNLAHLEEVLSAIDLLAADGIAFDSEAVELAAWFHDAVYVIGADDNEDRSAQLAGDLLPTPLGDEVSRLVLTTKTHKVTTADVNAAVLSDADLSVLGSHPARYRVYAAAVRGEYADIPDDVFKPARARVLTALLDGPIFHTGPGRDRWENRARRNVGAELAELDS